MSSRFVDGKSPQQPRSYAGSAITFGKLQRVPVTVDVVTAGKALGIGRTRAYEMAKRGTFPCRVLRLGRRYRVPTTELLRLLGVLARDEDTTA
jgi:hypothetical protein